MIKFELVLVAIILPLVLAACQSSGAGTSNYTAKALSTNTQNTTRPRVFINEAASSVIKRPVHKRKKTGTSKSGVASKSTKRSTKHSSGKKGRSHYNHLIAKHARANGVPVKFAMAVVQVESSYRANARGAAGEIGLMQLMPRTARHIGYKGKLKHLYHPDTNLRYGMKYLGKAYKLGGGSTCGAILKYNAGHGAKRMNPISRKYCKRVRRIMRKG